MLISDVIRDRLEKERKRYYANDNISEYITPEELHLLETELADKFKEVMKTLLIDDRDPNSKDTPRRWAKMYIHEFMKGRYYPPPKIRSSSAEKKLTPFSSDSYSGLLVIPSSITSLCAHHHTLIKGIVYVGILPDNTKILGLNKYIMRIVQWLTRRGISQEQLTTDIFKEIQWAVGTKDVAVMSILSSGCTKCNRTKESNLTISAAELGGKFFSNPALREEFYHHINLNEAQHKKGEIL